MSAPPLPMLKVFAIRHAEAEWNAEGRMMGQLDSPLTPRGVQQARALAGRLKGSGVRAVYASDLGRALRTAGYVAEAFDLEVRTDPGLRERHLGVFQGRTGHEVQTRFPAEWRALNAESFDYVIPEGESARECKNRSVRVMTEIAQRHTLGPIVVVTHGRFLMGFFEHVLAVPPGNERRFRRANAGLNVFSRTGDQWTLETWNDVGHLIGMLP